jgi:hypothetical protein
MSSVCAPVVRVYRFSIDLVRVAAAKVALQTQLSSASSSRNASSVELDHLKTRIEDVEREKRDLVSIVSRLKEDCVQRDGTETRSTITTSRTDILRQRRFLPFAPTSNRRGTNTRSWRARFESCAQPRTRPRYFIRSCTDFHAERSAPSSTSMTPFLNNSRWPRRSPNGLSTN